MPPGQADPPLSALEHCILTALRSVPERRSTIAELAHRTHLPEGTVRFSLQWLLACRFVRYEGERYHLHNEAGAD
jgi:DNA-binding IclR family transcriptional regulator